MANVRVKRTVLSKDEFAKAVDTSFTTFVDEQPQENNDTVEELFRLYNKLYYEIPVDEPNNSHRFLVQESSKLVEFEKDLTDIQPLLDEITYLREQILLMNQAFVEDQLEAATANGGNQI